MNLAKFFTDLGLYQKGIWKDYILILIGSFIMALGIGVFLVNAKVVPGGVSGLAMAIHYLSGNRIPVGLMIWVTNIPLYIWGIRELGRRFGIRTFVGFTFSSFFIDLLQGVVPGLTFIRLHEHPAIVYMLEHEFVLLVVMGGSLVGLGLGIIFKFHGTTGGTDIIAAILRKRFGYKPGHSLLTMDFFVIVIAGFIIWFKDLSPDRPALVLSLYAFFGVFIAARIIDVIIEGFDYARSAFIISEKQADVIKMITLDMDRGATALAAKGVYTNQSRDVIYTVLSKKEIVNLVDKVKAIDPDAFIIVNNVHEVLGEGFRPRF